ncbi:unnamed protein product [Durusdinium trenchii]|uniref:Uncharacterized protein n=1 Tax=Durusdinium trenchii TaxID=1381693 RepID=A0ABP0PQU4_9DINO
MADKVAFPFGPLVGNEEKVAARARRPGSAPPGSRPPLEIPTRWRGTPRVPRTFESLLRSGESKKLLGPKHNGFLEKVQQAVEQEQKMRKEDTEKASDGLYKRKLNEEIESRWKRSAQRPKNPKPSGEQWPKSPF